MTVPDDLELEIYNKIGITVELGESSVNDIIDDSPIITNDAPETFPLGETIVTWTATDSSGNSASATQTITVVDTTSPVLTVPDDLELEIYNKIGITVELGESSVNDIIDDSPIITNDAPETFPLGETIVTWTATDSSGNSASATQTITVVDTTSPVLTVPDDLELEIYNKIGITVELGESSVNDIIDDSPIITNDAPETFPLGETIVTWTATDKFGNISSSSQTISVQVCGNSPSDYNMIVGSEYDDVLMGTALSDLIFAFGGDDLISGNKGNDCIFGGDGDDIIFGNEGNDHISSQNGNDIVKGHSGEDYLFGGFGLDMIDGGEDYDSCKIIDEQNYDVIIRCELDE